MGHTLELSPTPRAVGFLEIRQIADVSPDRDNLDVFNLANDFKFHGSSVCPSACFKPVCLKMLTNVPTECRRFRRLPPVFNTVLLHNIRNACEIIVNDYGWKLFTTSYSEKSRSGRGKKEGSNLHFSPQSSLSSIPKDLRCFVSSTACLSAPHIVRSVGVIPFFSFEETGM